MKNIIAILLLFPMSAMAQDYVAANELYDASDIGRVAAKIDGPISSCFCATNLKSKPTVGIRLRDDATSDDCTELAGKVMPVRNVRGGGIVALASLLSCNVRVVAHDYQDQGAGDWAATMEALRQGVDQQVRDVSKKVAEEIFDIRKDVASIKTSVNAIPAAPKVREKKVEYVPVYQAPPPAPQPKTVEPTSGKSPLDFDE